MSTERILVQSSILPAFREALQKTISAIFPASNAGVTVMAAAVEKNKGLIADAVSKGAKVIHGDPNIEESTKTRMAPIVVEGVKKDMDLYYTESFGPSVSLIPFDKEEEAIDIANDTDYGLTGAVFTDNLARGFRIAKQIETG
jgi:acyl-CoA reductase-like NAD-dependent aldehyde dehydrogenase